MSYTQNYAKAVFPLSTIKSVVDNSARSPGYWVGLSGVVVLLTMMGPFGTDDLLGPAARLVYWGMVSLSCYFTTLVTVTPVFLVLRGLGVDWRVNSLLSGAIAGIPSFVIVFYLNTQIFSLGAGTLENYTQLFFVIVVTSVIGTALHMTIVEEFRHPREVRRQERERILTKRLSDRLDDSVVGRLISMQAQGHYVEVTTSRGKQLVLMRLKSAVSDVEELDGWQVHRSWWVAKDAVETVKRVNGRPQLTLKNGTTVPVSKYNLSQVKAWLAVQARK